MAAFAGEDRPAPTAPASSEVLPKADIQPMRQIGKYIVIEKLDDGGQAQVFRVLHPGLGLDFVLKLGRQPARA